MPCICACVCVCACFLGTIGAPPAARRTCAFTWRAPRVRVCGPRVATVVTTHTHILILALVFEDLQAILGRGLIGGRHLEPACARRLYDVRICLCVALCCCAGTEYTDLSPSTLTTSLVRRCVSVCACEYACVCVCVCVSVRFFYPVFVCSFGRARVFSVCIYGCAVYT